MARHKNRIWNLRGTETPDGQSMGIGWDDIKVATLMDIRDELQRLNSLLHCQNFIAIPRKLDAINRKLSTRRKRIRKT